MFTPIIAVAVLVVCVVSSCSSRPKSTITRTKAALSAAEEVRRGGCARQADQVEKDNPDSDSDDIISWFFHYSVTDNRCYVLQSSYNSRLGLKLNFLYDGQTNENLASTEQGNGQINGTIEGAPHMDCSPGTDCGYALGLEYINERIPFCDRRSNDMSGCREKP